MKRNWKHEFLFFILPLTIVLFCMQKGWANEWDLLTVALISSVLAD